MGHRAGQNLITEQQLGHSAGKVKTRFLLFASKTTCHLNRSLLWFKHVAEFFPPPGWWSVWALIFQLTAWVQQEGFQKKRSSLTCCTGAASGVGCSLQHHFIRLLPCWVTPKFKQCLWKLRIHLQLYYCCTIYASYLILKKNRRNRYLLIFPKLNEITFFFNIVLRKKEVWNSTGKCEKALC